MSTVHPHIPHSVHQNHLLDTLPTDELARLHPHLELVPMLNGKVLCGLGGKMNYIYFPTTSIVSLFNFTMDGKSTEIAMVGNEGLVGVSLFMGGNTTPNIPVVQNAGYAYRLKRHLLQQAFNYDMTIQHLLLRYTQALLTQIAQTAVCNRFHSVKQQLCRLLLLCLDRSPSSELTMTQELLANILGVRREGVTKAAGKLRQEGLIQYNRGHVAVLDRKGLETRVCECYQVVKREFDRLLPGYHTVQQYSSTAVQQYSSTAVQQYSSTAVQQHSRKHQQLVVSMVRHPGIFAKQTSILFFKKLRNSKQAIRME